MRYGSFLSFLFAALMAASLVAAGAMAEPLGRSSSGLTPPAEAPLVIAAEEPADPQDAMHQCKLGCIESCKSFANPGLREQCLASCNSKCSATYEP